MSGGLDRSDLSMMCYNLFTPDITLSDSPTGVGAWLFFAGDLSGNLASGVRGGLELYCLPQIFSAAFCVSVLAPSSAVQKAIRERYWEGSRVVAGAALKQLDGG